MSEVTLGDLRRVVLEVIADEADGRQVEPVLQEAATRLKSEYGSFSGEALLTVFYDLFRTGNLSWGLNLSNPNPPWFHVTDRGRRALQHLTRDPSNPDGYRAHLATRGRLSPVTDSYVIEALETYNAGCSKATAVMVGAAAESVVLELRDAVVARLQSLARAVPPDLTDWRMKRLLDALKAELDGQKANMPRPLADAYEAYWPAFTQQLRTTRNEAGHPISVAPVTEDVVHAGLLVFPELARLGTQLGDWVTRFYA